MLPGLLGNCVLDRLPTLLKAKIICKLVVLNLRSLLSFYVSSEINARLLTRGREAGENPEI